MTKLGTLDITHAYLGHIELNDSNLYLGTVQILKSLEPVYYLITVTQPSAGCTIYSDVEEAQEGDTVTLSHSAMSTGYQFSYYTVNGVRNNSGVFIMPDEDVTVGCVVTRVSYSVRTNNPNYGSVAVSPSSAYYGDTVNVYAYPNSGYIPDTITLSPNTNQPSAWTQAPGMNRYTSSFTMPAASVVATVTFKVAPAGPPMTFVDFGLPSGTKWGQYDYGVNSNSLSNAQSYYGDLYAWGETSPKQEYTLNNYQYYNTNTGEYTKYNEDDGISQLQATDDAIHVAYGQNYYIPTTAEVFELMTNIGSSSWQLLNISEVTNFNNVSGLNGIKLYKKSDPSIYIFFPYSSGSSFGEYWTTSTDAYNHGKGTSAEDDTQAYSFKIDDEELIWNPGSNRYIGLRLRPILRNTSYSNWWVAAGKSTTTDDDDDDNPGKEPINYDDDSGKYIPD